MQIEAEYGASLLRQKQIQNEGTGDREWETAIASNPSLTQKGRRTENGGKLNEHQKDPYYSYDHNDKVNKNSIEGRGGEKEERKLEDDAEDRLVLDGYYDLLIPRLSFGLEDKVVNHHCVASNYNQGYILLAPSKANYAM